MINIDEWLNENNPLHTFDCYEIIKSKHYPILFAVKEFHTYCIQKKIDFDDDYGEITKVRPLNFLFKIKAKKQTPQIVSLIYKGDINSTDTFFITDDQFLEVIKSQLLKIDIIDSNQCFNNEIYSFISENEGIKNFLSNNKVLHTFKCYEIIDRTIVSGYLLLTDSHLCCLRIQDNECTNSISSMRSFQSIVKITRKTHNQNIIIFKYETNEQDNSKQKDRHNSSNGSSNTLTESSLEKSENYNNLLIDQYYVSNPDELLKVLNDKLNTSVC